MKLERSKAKRALWAFFKTVKTPYTMIYWENTVLASIEAPASARSARACAICFSIIMRILNPACSAELLRYSYKFLAFIAIIHQLLTTIRAELLLQAICSTWAPNHSLQPYYQYLLAVFKLFYNSPPMQNNSPWENTLSKKSASQGARVTKKRGCHVRCCIAEVAQLRFRGRRLPQNPFFYVLLTSERCSSCEPNSEGVWNLGSFL